MHTVWKIIRWLAGYGRRCPVCREPIPGCSFLSATCGRAACEDDQLSREAR